ncbi:restriction endonuclease subunit S [Nocardia amikacinitolerans]|uniref:restriction endonuclease subunit S n=1 Tax=Nocardia amikacinitolerans TaxID=756689 RepID=UPI0020A2AA93|nr:restriction endonuclease subunit S [Nocardia amikacinitolerans]MCP2290968.1 type I restriction enzyme, S subunit [Nocardia amikacinitolerans]
MISDFLQEQGWEFASIGEVAEVNPRKPKYDGLTDDAPVGFVPMAAVEESRGVVSTIEERSLGELRGKSYRTFATGDVLFAKITPCMENGKMAVVPNLPSGHGFGSTEFHVLRPSRRVDARYLWHFVRQQTYRRQAERHMTGSVGQLRVPAEFLRDTQLLLPPISEQRRIVELLDEVDQEGDAAATNLARVGRLLADFRRAVLAAACSGRLTEDWRDSHPNALPVDISKSAVRQRGRKQRQKSRTDFEVPDIPEPYVVAPLGAIAAAIEYGTSRKADGDESNVPVLRMGNIRDGSLDLRDLKYITRDNEIDRLLLRDGDLLFNRTNSPELVGKSAVWRGSKSATFASYLIRVRFHEDAAVPEFVNYWINSAWGRAWARQVKTDGVSQSNINGTKLGAMPVPLPPLEEQREIVRRVEKLLKGRDEILAKVSAVSSLLEHSCQSVIGKAFRGEIQSD